MLTIHENDYTKVEISKTDITGEHELGGAKLSVLDKDGNLVETWVSKTGEKHIIYRLPVGKYVLREETAPYGYKKAVDVEFEVSETGIVQRVTMKDEQVVGKIIIDKKDEKTKHAIAGVEFEIRDKDGNLIEKLVTDENGHAESKELNICTYNEDGSFKEAIHYYVVETKAAKGYVLNDEVREVVFEYEGDAPQVVEYHMEITNEPIVEVPKTGDHTNPWAYLIAIMGSALLVTLVSKKRKTVK